MKKDCVCLLMMMAMFFLTSCRGHDYDPVVYPETLDGVWVESFKNLSEEGKKGIILNVVGERSVLNCFEMDNMGGMFLDSQQDVDVSYDKGKGTGVIVFPSGKEEEIPFAIGSTGMFLTDRNTILTHYNRTFNDILNGGENRKDIFARNDKDFIGVEKYVESSIPAPSLPMAFLDWLLPIVGRTAVTYGCNALFKEIFGSEESKQMEAIMSAIEDVNHHLAELTELFHNTTYEKYLNDRSNNYVSPLMNYTSDYYTLLKNCDGSEEAIRKIVVEWGDGTVGGNKACVEYQNFIDFLTKTVVEHKNLYQIYDLYVFNTTPWEHQGYEFREGLRSCDLAVISENALMAALYYRVKEGYDDASREEFLAKIDRFVNEYAQFAAGNAVERHDDLAVCQIKDAHFAMKKELVVRDYYRKPWFPNGSEWDNEYNDAVWFVVYGDTYYTCPEIYGKCLTSKEVKVLSSYYAQAGITNLTQVLVEEAGCSFPVSVEGKTPILLLQGDGSLRHDEYNDYYISATNAVRMNNGFSAGSQDIGIAYLESYGFLWMKTRFAYWTASFNHNNVWLRTDVVSRD